MNESPAAAAAAKELTSPEPPPGNKPQRAMPFLKRYPIIAGAFAGVPDEHGVVEQALRVNAPAAVVWRQLHEATDIEAHEVADAWAFRIGVPLPISGITRETPQGRVRESRWGKGVRFDEIIQDWQPERHVRWTYRFAADSFPPGALDDHVLIGGHYFDLLDTSYSLTPQGESTLVAIRIRYRISTQFNVYSDWVAQALLGNFGDVILRMYKNRSESE